MQQTPPSEDNLRRIANTAHNHYLAEGIDPHQTTQIAPPTLLQPLPASLKNQIEQRQHTIASILKPYLGEPFYANDGFILYQGDATQWLDRVRSAEVAIPLTITSPPYNIGKAYEQPRSVEDYIVWCANWMQQLYQVTTAQGAFWLNLGYLEVPDRGLCVPIPYLLWDKSPFYLIQEIVWHYGAGVSTRHRLSPRNEKWLFYVKDRQQYTFNLDDIRDPNVKYPDQKKAGKYRCNPLGKNPSDVWQFPKVTTGAKRSSKERTGHPAQFPLGIVERIVRASSHPGELVFDPFAGSGSTGIAAYGLGRLFVGVEIRLDYCEMAVKRFEQFKIEQKTKTEQKNRTVE